MCCCAVHSTCQLSGLCFVCPGTYQCFYCIPHQLITCPAACSEHLKQEGERRAKQFQAAVQAAVGKIQSELETERDALQAK